MCGRGGGRLCGARGRRWREPAAGPPRQRYDARGPVVFPGTNGQSNTNPAGGSVGPANGLTARRSAEAPIGSNGTDTLVNGGQSSAIVPGASKPVIDRSPGTRTPR